MPQRTRAVRSDGVRSREAILATATDLASVHGLEGLSIGGLADAVGMSKSGLYAHFGSKEELQVATVGAARQVFIEEVVVPAFEHDDALSQLRALCDGFLRYVEARVFPGGCFFVAAAAEFGSRPGPVHDAVAAAQREWTELLETVAAVAAKEGSLPRRAEPATLAFELVTLLSGANLTYVLHDDVALLAQARGILDRLLT